MSGDVSPAMVLNAVSLLKGNKQPSSKEIKDCVGGTICRCTGYTKIEQAVSAAAKAVAAAELQTAGKKSDGR